MRRSASNDNYKFRWYHHVQWGCVGALLGLALFWVLVVCAIAGVFS